MTIVDGSGEVVPSALVSGSWSGATTDSDALTTGLTGMVMIYSDYIYNPSPGTTYTFTVADVSLSGWTYDAAANEVTSNSIER